MSRARRILAVAVAYAAGCSPPPAPPRHASARRPVPIARSVDAAVAPRPTPAVWRERAAEAAAGGISDVAAAALGLAYAGEPSAEGLHAWIDALVASGQRRESRAALERAAADAERRHDAALVAAVARERARVPTTEQGSGESKRLERPPSPALRAARLAEAAGRIDDAIVALQGALGAAQAGDDPSELATRGDLAWRKGDAAGARRSWAAARIALDELGAAVELVPITSHRTTGAFWAGEDLVLIRAVTPIRYGGATSTALERWSSGDWSAPRQRLLLAIETSTAVPIADGAKALVAAGHDVAILDTTTGAVDARVELGLERPRVVAAGGEGDGLGIVVATPKGAELFDRTGKRLEAFAITGKTPTITRVYSGPDAHHDNILGDAPTWATALAVTDDLGRVAIGGSDSKVRLVDRRAKTTKLLEFSWPFEDHRALGANPDLNQPVDMRFGSGGRTLVVLHSHGDVLTWDVPTGKPIAHLGGACSRDEGLVDKNRYVEPGGQRLEPSLSDLERCGRAGVGTLSPDGSRVGTGIMFSVRVRGLPSGAPEALLVESLLPSDLLAFSKSGRLAMVDHYGATALWSASKGLSRARQRPEATGPIAPALSASGRFLTFDRGRADVVWDLARAASPSAVLPPDALLLAVSDDGTRTVVQTKAGVEIRGPGARRSKLDLPAGRVRARFADTGERLLVDVEGDSSRRVTVRDLARDLEVVVALPPKADAPVLSRDGRRLVSFGREQTIAVWDTSTGRSVATVDPGPDHVALAPDGSFLATLERTGKSRRARATVHRFDGSPPRTLYVEGWSAGVDVSPDGAEVLLLMEGGVVRWRPATGERLDDPGDWQHGIRRAHYSADGRVILFERYDSVEIRRRDEPMTLLATLFPLLTGGWLAQSANGAVDGTSDAPDATVTRATTGREVLVLTARASWDRWRVPGVVARALEDEIATPPAPGKPLAPPVEPPKPRVLTRLDP